MKKQPVAGAVLARRKWKGAGTKAAARTAAQELGHKGGVIGGVARKEKLTPAERTEIAQHGGAARADSLSSKVRSRIAKHAADIRWGNKQPGSSY